MSFQLGLARKREGERERERAKTDREAKKLRGTDKASDCPSGVDAEITRNHASTQPRPLQDCDSRVDRRHAASQEPDPETLNPYRTLNPKPLLNPKPRTLKS